MSKQKEEEQEKQKKQQEYDNKLSELEQELKGQEEEEAEEREEREEELEEQQEFEEEYEEIPSEFEQSFAPMNVRPVEAPVLETTPIEQSIEPLEQQMQQIPSTPSASESGEPEYALKNAPSYESGYEKLDYSTINQQTDIGTLREREMPIVAPSLPTHRHRIQEEPVGVDMGSFQRQATPEFTGEREYESVIKAEKEEKERRGFDRKEI